MWIKIVMTAIHLAEYLKDIILGKVSDRQDAKPLPEEVRDVYEPERYRAYLARKRERRNLGYVEKRCGARLGLKARIIT